jgi:hypothetical protein
MLVATENGAFFPVVMVVLLHAQINLPQFYSTHGYRSWPHYGEFGKACNSESCSSSLRWSSWRTPCPYPLRRTPPGELGGNRILLEWPEHSWPLNFGSRADSSTSVVPNSTRHPARDTKAYCCVFLRASAAARRTSGSRSFRARVSAGIAAAAFSSPSPSDDLILSRCHTTSVA